MEPKLATWLLLKLGSGSHLESVAGDLHEQFHVGRSRLWYWRQVLLAIIVSAFGEVRAHKLAAMGALLLGWVSIGVIFSYGEALDKRFTYAMVWSDWAILSAPDWLRMAAWRYRMLPVSYLGFTTAGFVIGLYQGRTRTRCC